jgi:hypothetical protein
MSSVFTLCNTAIGAGVLGLPFAFRCSGQGLFSEEFFSVTRHVAKPMDAKTIR